MIVYSKEEMIAIRCFVKKWKKGDLCMAPFSEDGKYYEAKIRSIDVSDISCEVVFTEYETKEKVKLADLLSDKDVEWFEMVEDEEVMDEDLKSGLQKEHSSEMAGNSKEIFPDVLPVLSVQNVPDLGIWCPPSFLLFNSTVPANDLDTAKKNALLSYFVAGFHTGYYRAIADEGMQKKKMSDPEKSTNPGRNGEAVTKRRYSGGSAQEGLFQQRNRLIKDCGTLRKLLLLRPFLRAAEGIIEIYSKCPDYQIIATVPFVPRNIFLEAYLLEQEDRRLFGSSALFVVPNQNIVQH